MSTINCHKTTYLDSFWAAHSRSATYYLFSEFINTTTLHMQFKTATILNSCAGELFVGGATIVCINNRDQRSSSI